MRACSQVKRRILAGHQRPWACAAQHDYCAVKMAMHKKTTERTKCWKCSTASSQISRNVVENVTLCGHWLSTTCGGHWLSTTCGGHGLGWCRFGRWMECISEKNFIGALFGKIQNKPCQISKVEDWTNYGMSLMHFRLKRISDCRNFPFLHLQCIGKEISHYLLPLAFIPQKWHSQWHFY